MIRWLLALLLTVFSVLPVAGHEVRPGLLQLQETGPDQFDMLWRVPARGDLALSLMPVLPGNCETIGVPVRHHDGLRSEERQTIECPGGLAEARIAIEGLSRVQTDVLVSVTYLSGGTETLRASPKAPEVSLQGERSLAQVSATYLWLGVEHILLGIDHLMFVTALLFLVLGWKRLLGTITAFTLAHSITLVGASLGVLSAPPALVEALIALSIVVVAAEVVLKNRGRTGIAIERPWLIAFGFGLLHGFGFAGALSDIGLPANAVPAALLFFNIGVEVGQILFIGVLLTAGWLTHRILPASERIWRRAIPVFIGVMAGFWTVERTLAIWT
jgi:hydrogenase/urease accessory protein HupE